MSSGPNPRTIFLAPEASMFALSLAMLSRMASLAARWQISVMSAPENPFVTSAMESRFTASSIGLLRKQESRIARRLFLSGSGMYMSWSRRPGRVMAASRTSGRFVAPMTKTVFFEPTPSISVRIWLMTRSPASLAPPPPLPRALAMESISSKKRMQGAAARALSKSSRTFASDSPNHIVRSSGPLIDMKLAPHSLAMACASKVLPHPGGP
mmetsp:Transcript_25338/g.34818  ORF Transcript_25338/g.34818 Transcript_25338/m.34818 type:complete len:211 (+) Transcript_25338:580-1212(+)